MRILVLGFVRRTGKAKASGRPFDFAQLLCATVVEQVVGENYSALGEGFQQTEVPLENGTEGQFKGLKFPTVLELKMDFRPGPRGQMEGVCIGFTKPASAAAA
jgi:hypothetical protein